MANAKQPPEFQIRPNFPRGLAVFFYSQLFVTPPYPKHSFAGQTVIVTGANTGLGLEAARHFYRLGAHTLILAVRTVSNGETAKEDIVRSVLSRTDADAIQVWPLDQAGTQSTLAFAQRVRDGLPRVDVAVLNAGVNNEEFRLCEEGVEETTQVNVLNTFLLALALLPKMRETRARFEEARPHLTVVSSEAHRLTTFGEINAADLYERLNEREEYSQHPRYQVSKLLEVLLTRELVARLKPTTKPGDTPPVIINLVNPGLCTSTLGFKAKPAPLVFRLLRKILDRTAEVGGRTFVLAACAPADSHGEFHSDGAHQDVEAWIYTEMGRRVQQKVWEQTVRILEARNPGILRDAGL